MEDALIRMQNEWMQMPGRKLTLRQAQRLWSLSTDVCEAAFTALVTKGFLGQTPDGAYARRAFIGPSSREGFHTRRAGL